MKFLLILDRKETEMNLFYTFVCCITKKQFLMADNYLENKYEEYLRKKSQVKKVRKINKSGKITTHTKTQFRQDDIREDSDDDR